MIEELVLPMETMSEAAADALETMFELDELGVVGYTAARLLRVRPDLDRYSATTLDEGLRQLERLGYADGLDDEDDQGLPIYSYAHCGSVLGSAAITRDRRRHYAAAEARKEGLRAPRGRISVLAERVA